MNWLDNTSTLFFIIAALTLGLAPFVPEPHVWEKLKMLASQDLNSAVDIFDLALHGVPWLLLSIKVVRVVTRKDAA